MKKVIWFTGLSGSGKSTIAEGLKKVLEARGKRVHIVDADDVRASYPEPLGFTREDIRENNKRHAVLAQEMLGDYDIIIVAIISPYAEDRAMVRDMLGNAFVLVYVSALLDTVIARDTKGMYSKAQCGEMDNLIGMTGSKVAYEVPESPDLVVKTDDNEEATVGVQMIVDFLGI